MARAELHNDTLSNLQVIFRQEPKTVNDQLFGSRMAFARDGTLFVTLADRFEFDEHDGKVLRLTPEPEDSTSSRVKQRL